MVPVLLGFSSAAFGEQVSPSPSRPKAWTETQEWRGGAEGQDWSPLLSHKEHLFLPALRGPVNQVKRGDIGGFEELIRTAYRLMAAYGRNEGHAVTFELSDFRTVRTPEALNLKFGDLVSIGLPDHITVSGNTREFERNGRKVSVKRGYSMRWERVQPFPDQEAWKKRPISEYVKDALPEQPALPYLRAVTSYRVVVTLDGARRDYRAAFLWMGSSSSPVVQTISCLDPVTDRVTLVLAEQVPPEGEGSARAMPDKGLGILSQPASFGSCQVYTRYPSTTLFTRQGTERHTGDNHHEILAEIGISCHCSSSCESVCYPSLQAQGCTDTGGTQFGYHVAATDNRMTHRSVLDAYGGVAGASCDGAYACAMAQCAYPLCAFSINLNATGPGFTSNPSGAAFWGITHVQGANCSGCELNPERPPDPEIPKEVCPVLVALNGRHLEMTDLAGGVRFDLDRDGLAELLSWTAPGSSWAFLARDRNLNGRIDDGGELFGNYSPQPLETGDPNGYAALAVFDQAAFGGNDDGLIDARDTIFPFLLLWLDDNHDGVSQPGELKPASQKLHEIELVVKESRARDRYGNQFRYRSKVTLADGKKSHSVDVFLLAN